MISVIVCSQKDPQWLVHRNHIARSIGSHYEYIAIDNRKNEKGICAAYNEGVSRARGDICVFVHEDVFFVTQSWGKVLLDTFANNEECGMVGVAGTQFLFAHNPFWAAAGRPFIHGKVIHENKKSDKRILTVFSRDEIDTQVVALDGLFFAVRRSLFDTISFDEKTFDQFHFYDLDIGMQVQNTHTLLCTKDILVKHLSGGSFNEKWRAYAVLFLRKYKKQLPFSCSNKVPDPSRRIDFESFDLDTMVKPEMVDFIKKLDLE